MAERNCNIFVEKPLSHNLINAKKFSKIIKRKKLITHVGYQLRYHPAVNKIYNIIKKKLGKPLSGTFYFGEYPGNVRTYEKFSGSHMANKKMGGGVLLALSHYLDLCMHFFGKLKLKTCYIKNTKNYQINVEDLFHGIFYHKTVDIQLNLNFLDAEQK